MSGVTYYSKQLDNLDKIGLVDLIKLYVTASSPENIERNQDIMNAAWTEIAKRMAQINEIVSECSRLRQDADNWRRWIARLNRLEPGQIISIGREPGQDVYDEDKDEYHLTPADDDHYWAQLNVEEEDSDVDCEVFEDGETPLDAIIAAKLMEDGQ